MTNPLTLVVLYSNMNTQKFKVQNRRHAEFIIHDEGDHVMDWYIEEDRNTAYNKTKKQQAKESFFKTEAI